VAVLAAAPAWAQPPRLTPGRLVLRPPTGARVRLLGRGRFEAQERPIHVDRETHAGLGYAVQPSQLDRLRGLIEKNVGPFRARTIFYPMAGYDAGTAQRLFPEATTIIGVDNHPFLPETPPARISYGPAPAQNVVLYRNVDHLAYVGPAAIGQLQAMVPGFRLRRVYVVTTEELQGHRGESGFKQLSDSDPRRVPSGHGIVEYDTGPGTPLRRYVHINASLLTQGNVESTWWWNAIERMAPDTVLVKGAEEAFQHRAAYHLRPSIRSWLHRAGGTLVEEVLSHDAGTAWVPQFSGFQSFPKLPTASIDVREAGLERFGYTHRIQVTRYPR
jgi:hypothetical protein